MPQASAHAIVMPRLTDSMEEGAVVQWLKAVGDQVEQGEPLVEIETDKATMTYESDASGTLLEIVVGEDATVSVGTTIGLIGDPGAAPPPAPEAEPQVEGGGAPGREIAAAAALVPAHRGEQAAKATRTGRPKASPVARRIAATEGVDLTALAGSGPNGRIVKADVERAAAELAKPPAGGAVRATTAGAGPAITDGAGAASTHGAAPAVETNRGAGEFVPLSRRQRTIARRMAESRATIPDFEVRVDVDMTRVVAMRAELKALARDGVPVPSVNDVVIRACALALRDFPRVNASYEGEGVRLHSRINIGMAVAAEGALVVPTIFDADQKPVREIARVSRELAGRVRDGSITPPELAGGTFTVSNLGMHGVDSFTPVINPPQVALLAVGRLARRPWVGELGELEAREQLTAALAADHRVLYGADAADFLARVREYLEQPLLAVL